MMDRTSPVRKHTRFPVRWPMVYGNGEFVSEGTLLDVTQTGWRVAGMMPVRPGMRLAIRVWPHDKGGRINVTEATVLWVKGCEFAIEVPVLAPEDREWITRFLHQKLSLSWMSQAFPSSPPEKAAPFLQSTEPEVTSLRRITQKEDACIQRELVRQVGIATGGRAAVARLTREAGVIIRGIRARQARRARTGDDSIANN